MSVSVRDLSDMAEELLVLGQRFRLSEVYATECGWGYILYPPITLLPECLRIGAGKTLCFERLSQTQTCGN